MAHTQQRRIALAALGIAVTGFIVDRTLLSGQGLRPVSAQAAVSAADQTGAEQAPGVSAAAPQKTISQRLSEVAARLDLDPTQARNAFVLAGVTRIASENEDAHRRGEEFAKKHRLQAIMAGPNGHIAVIGQKWLVLNDELDGFRLAGIDNVARTVLFIQGDLAVELVMK